MQIVGQVHKDGARRGARALGVTLALAIAAMVIARHHENIRRLLAGTEPRIGQRGPNAESA